MIIDPVELSLALAWSGLVGIVWLAVVLAVLATTEAQPRLVIVGVGIVVVGGLAVASGASDALPSSSTLLAQLGMAALGIAGGGPVATLVLAAASRGSAAPAGTHGGILVGEGVGREVLRGGTTIGFLERTIIVAAVLIGRWELLAALIAIKGLGRFRDLDAGAATERFIIGTLVSLLWAGACAGLIVLA